MKNTIGHSLLNLCMIVALSNAALASDVTAPSEVVGSAPSNMHLIYFNAGDNGRESTDALAVYEAASDTSGTRKRELVVFRKIDGHFHEVARSDRIIACS